MQKPEIVNKRAMKQRRHAMCFVGSLGYGWNNVIEYIDFMKKVLKIDSSMSFELYVLKTSRSVVEMELKRSGIPSDNYIIDSLPPDKVGSTISGCLAGLQIMSKRDTRLGIKTVDYLAAGVPVICNDNAVGAAKVIMNNQIGWNIDNLPLEEILLQTQEKNLVMKCTEYAYSNFSTEVVANKYFETYASIMVMSL